jgi:ATP-dependent Clp protease ATP-binding subunit ClpB
MNMEKLTQKSRQALASAQQLAAQRHHQEISGKHLMAVLIKQEDGITPRGIHNNNNHAFPDVRPHG